MEQLPLTKLFNPNIPRKNIIESDKIELDDLANIEVETIRTDITPIKENKPPTKVESASNDSDDESNDSETQSGISDIETNVKSRQNDEKFKELTDIKRGLNNRIGRFRNLGFKIPEMKGDENIDELIKIVDSLEYEKKYNTNVRFFRHIISFLGWVIENVAIRIGFQSLKGFSRHVGSLTHEFDEFYDDMTEPTYVKTDDGEYVKIEKRNIINYIHTKTELAICVRFALMASAYSATSKLETLAELMA